MATAERDYTVAALAKGLRVIEHLAWGEILEWKTVPEISRRLGLSPNETYRILKTLTKAGWAEESDKGYRQASKGLIAYGLYAQEYLDRLAMQIGVRKPIL